MASREREVLAEGQAILAEPVEATLHAAPRATTFSAGALPALAQLAALDRALPRTEEDAVVERSIRAGKVPFGSLPSSWAVLLAQADRPVDQLLTATRAPSLAGWTGLWIEHEGPHSLGREVHLAAQLAALRVRKRLESGRSGGALVDCADLAALARIASVRGGHVGYGIGMAIIGMAIEPCAAAIDRSSENDAARFAVQLARIRGALPSPVEATREEEVVWGLIAYGWMMRARGLTLPEPFEHVAGRQPEHLRKPGLAATVGLWAGEFAVVGPVLRLAQETRRWRTVAALPDEERTREFLSLRAEFAAWHARHSGLMRNPTPDLARVLTRFAYFPARLSLLRAAAETRAGRGREGRWTVQSGDVPVLAARTADGGIRLTLDETSWKAVGLEPPAAPAVELHASVP